MAFKLEPIPLPVNYHELDREERPIVRQRYFKLQYGLCYHCGQSLMGKPSSEALSYAINWSLFPPNFLTYPVHLHHSHKTGLTIGSVHAWCNAVLWQHFGE